jgi:hypothetical protein
MDSKTAEGVRIAIPLHAPDPHQENFRISPIFMKEDQAFFVVF